MPWYGRDSMKPFEWRRVVAPWIIVVTTVAAYWPALHGPPVFDDAALFVSLSRTSLGQLARLDSLAGPLSRNVTQLTFALNHYFSGADTFAYHLTNVGIHLAVVLLLFLLGRIALQRAGIEAPGGPAFVTAAVFAVHPMQTQAVSYIVQRAESLASMFYVLFVLLLVVSERARPRLRYLAWGGSLLSMYLGIGSKAIVATAPIAYLLLRLVLPAPVAQGDEKPTARSRSLTSWLLGATVGLCAIGAAIATVPSFFKASSHASAVGFSIPGLSGWEYALTQARVVLAYLRLLVLPVGQSLDHDFPISRSLLELPTAFSVALVAALVGAAIFGATRTWAGGASRAVARLSAFGFLWFLLVLSPTSTFIPVLDVMVEHRVYLASWGIYLPLVAAGTLGVRRLLSPTAGHVTATLMLAVLAAATWSRNHVWASDIALWQDVVAKPPGKPRAHLFLANAYVARGELKAAEAEYRRCLELNGVDPDPRALVGLGNALLRQNRAAEAVDVLLPADGPGLGPFASDLRSILAVALLEVGRLSEAERAVRSVLASNPLDSAAHNTLGEVRLAGGDAAGARQEFLEALRLDPGSEVAAFNAGVAAERIGDREDACRHFARYVEITRDPNSKREVREEMRTELGCP